MSLRTVEEALTAMNFPQITTYIDGGISKENSSGIYMPPFIRPSVSRGEVVTTPPYAPYGAAQPLVDAETLANIQMLAPPVAQLIANTTPEEAVAILQGKVQQLQPYKSLPIVGPVVTAKIQEYRGRIKALKDQVAAEEYKRKSLYIAYTLGVISISALTIALTRKAFQK